jgi:hypothetical protein
MYAQSQKFGKQKRLKVLGVRKPKGMHMVATIGTGHLHTNSGFHELFLKEY